MIQTFTKNHRWIYFEMNCYLSLSVIVVNLIFKNSYSFPNSKSIGSWLLTNGPILAICAYYTPGFYFSFFEKPLLLPIFTLAFAGTMLLESSIWWLVVNGTTSPTSRNSNIPSSNKSKISVKLAKTSLLKIPLFYFFTVPFHIIGKFIAFHFIFGIFLPLWLCGIFLTCGIVLYFKSN